MSNQKSRKWLLTINNPLEHGYSHEQIKKNMLEIKTEYWCMCDEVGEGGTPHTHIYLAATNAILFTTLQKRFRGAHFDAAKGTHQQNRDYVRKEGKYLDSEKKETNLPDTFEEFGVMPIERVVKSKFSDELYEMIKADKSNYEILECFPSAMSKLNQIEQVRQTLRSEKYANQFRPLEVWYIFGESGVGKTRSVMEKYGYSNVYRIPNYQHPFDQYSGQDVILFDEFRSSLPISEMLQYLDGYPVHLPCRYNNKIACYTKVYIISNIPLDEQYKTTQADQPETWKALLRRIQHIEKFK